MQADAERGGAPPPTSAFSIVGVLLFGSGITTCFVANWERIPKLISDPEYFVEMPQT